MSTTATDEARTRLLSKFKAYRRKRVKTFGKRLIRRLIGFFGSQSLVGDMPIHDNSTFPFIKAFEDNWQTIRAELDEVLRHREAVPFLHEVSIDQSAISMDTNWRTFMLFGFGTKAEFNCRQVPVTTSLLEMVPNIQNAWFSIIGPRYHIPPHRGVTKGMLRSHLGLIVPKERTKCRMRVKETVMAWEEGKAIVFDDCYNHEVWNDTDEERVVLLFDFYRPMRLPGRLLNAAFLGLLRRTAFFKEPKQRMKALDARFEESVRKAKEGGSDAAA